MARGSGTPFARLPVSHALIIRRRAEHDMAEAGLWYEIRRPGTALYFIRCVDAAIHSSHDIPRQAQCSLVSFAVS